MRANEISYHTLWTGPAVGRVPVRDIVALHVGMVFIKMSKAGLTTRTIQMAMGFLKLVIGKEIDEGYHPGPNPVGIWKRDNRLKLKFDNMRTRFFFPQ